MVPYHNPIPERKQDGKNPQSGGSFLGAWVQAEKMVQIALMLPCAGFIGWLAGYGLDRWLHQTWIGVAGAVFGIIAGLVSAVRMAAWYGGDSGSGRSDENGSDAGKPGSTGGSSTAP